MLRIRIDPNGATLSTEGPCSLMDALDDQGSSPLPLSCRSARCGICLVAPISGAHAFEPASAEERDTLAFLQAGAGQRLACQLQVRDGANGEAVLRSLRALPRG